MNDPTGRVLQLLSLLQTHKFWPGADLAQRLEVSDRTLRRDVDRLRLLGYQVDATPGQAGGYRLAAGPHMPPLVLDDEEAVAIAVGLRAAAGASIDGMEETSVRALAKLEQVLPNHLRRRVNAVHSNVTPLRWTTSAVPMVDAGALAVLAQACRDSEEVRFEYQARDGEETRRLVQPHQLVSAGRRWYLVAWDVRRSDWRTFRLDRLRDPQLAGARFTPKALPAADAAAYVAQSLGSLPKPFEVTLVASGSLDVVNDALRWADARVEEIDGGARCRATIRSDSLDWLVATLAFVAVWVPIEVEGPPEVADRVAALAERLQRAQGRAGSQSK